MSVLDKPCKTYKIWYEGMMVLIWHGGSTLLVVAGFALAGRGWRDRSASRFTAV